MNLVMQADNSSNGPPVLRFVMAGALLVSLPACSDVAGEKPTKGPSPRTADLGQPALRNQSGKEIAAAPKAVAEESYYHPKEIEKVEQSAAGGASATERTGEDWAEFLGPRGTGISGETGLLEKWTDKGPPILWKKKIGEGYSAPSVRGNRLVLFHRPGEGPFSGEEE